MENVTTVSQVLRTERKRLGLTQGELAAKLECTQQNLSEIERGDSHPSDKLLDKMLEVFGHDSPLAYVSRRGEVRVPPPRGFAEKFLDKVGSVLEATDPHLNAMWNAGSEAIGGRELESRVHSQLPNDLKQYWTGGSTPHPGRVDYISPRLIAEVKMIKGQNISTMARLAMHQLSVARAVLGHDRKCLLALVFSDMGVMFTRGFVDIGEEGEALGIKMAFCNDAGAVANTIANIEHEIRS